MTRNLFAQPTILPPPELFVKPTALADTYLIHFAQLAYEDARKDTQLPPREPYAVDALFNYKTDMIFMSIPSPETE